MTVANWLLKASGPLVLGHRRLPRVARHVVALVAPVLLAGLIVIELAGPDWDGLDWRQIVGRGGRGRGLGAADADAGRGPGRRRGHRGAAPALSRSVPALVVAGPAIVRGSPGSTPGTG